MNTEKRIAPYGPPGTIIKIIRNFRDRDVPETLTPEILAQLGVTEGLTNRVLQSLVFLGLLAEDGSTTPEFRAIPTKSDEEYRQLLSGLIRNAYAGIFRVVDIANVSDQDLHNAFRPYSPAGQRPRMATLFRGLCREAGISIGGMIEATAAPPRSVLRQRPREPARLVSRERAPGGAVSGGKPIPSATFQTLIGILDPNKMSEEEQAAVWTLIRYLKKQEA